MIHIVNLIYYLIIIREYNYPSTLFIDADLALKDTTNTKLLAKYAELNPIVDFSFNSSSENDDLNLPDVEG